jgi:hypothetical protein
MGQAPMPLIKHQAQIIVLMAVVRAGDVPFDTQVDLTHQVTPVIDGEPECALEALYTRADFAEATGAFMTKEEMLHRVGVPVCSGKGQTSLFSR